MSTRPMNLPQTRLADLRRQLSYYDSLKARVQKKANEKIAEYSARQEAVRAEIALEELNPTN